MIRGEVWRYAPEGSPRVRTILIVSADGINRSSRRWVYGLDIVDDDPEDMLAVRLVDGRWISGTSLSRLWRDWLVERLGAIDGETEGSIDGMLRGALDL